MQFRTFIFLLATLTSLYSGEISYNRDIQPILSENCFFCHGPDSASRKPKDAPFRLDLEEFAMLERKDSSPAIVPGHPEKSYMIHLMESKDPNEVMPLHPSRDPAHGKVMKQSDIDLVKEWIRQGAKYEPHWAYVAPVKAPLPQPDSSWAKNAVDHFVAEKHSELKLKPNPEQNKQRLLRRLTLDLTGVPPTPSELSSFLNDKRKFDEVYSDKVKQLLKTTAHAEHMARLWLDVARYADTQGIHHDHHRSIWPYRDWVVNAFKENMPFDQFTKEQIAGDLIPKPKVSQKVATGYLRCLPTSGEGGLIQDEYAAMYAQDRVDALAATWLGLTTNCASCHDHKFDQLSTKEVYQLTAFFRNNISVISETVDGRNGTNLYLGDPKLGKRLNPARSELGKLNKEIKQLKRKAKKEPHKEKLARKEAEAKALRKEINSILAKGATTLVYQEKKNSEPHAHILIRGSYAAKGERVLPNTPAILPPLISPDQNSGNETRTANRLDLAKWLVREDNPLPARVTTNRYWSYFFGQGFLKNNEDFGAMGGHPSHPELLDWLAKDFIDSGWNLRHLIETIVTSATYRQEAIPTTKNREKDPDNVYLTRGPRYRLDAEQIRDLALASSNLLSTKVGGPPVKPYQPDGLWLISMTGSTSRNYVESKGEDLYRRSLYTYWKRQALHPTMEILNATNRQVPCTSRSTTNTPLQALVLLNDPQFMEAAREIATNAVKAANTNIDILTNITTLVLSRTFSKKEEATALQSYDTLLKHYTNDTELADKLLDIGAKPANKDLNKAKLAAWTVLASQILNLDEALTK